MNKKLTIRGTGSLTASSNGFGAGIGGGNGISCGDIRIEGGTIKATGGSGAAGIGCGTGSGYGASYCGTILIRGGNVTATGGYFAAGIGSGYANGASSVCGDIRIEGGTVLATAGSRAASIGEGIAEGGYFNTCYSITFTTGITRLRLKNSEANESSYAVKFLNAGQVVAHDVDISGNLDGYNGIISFFNDRNPDFIAKFPNSSFDEHTHIWTIAP